MSRPRERCRGLAVLVLLCGPLLSGFDARADDGGPDGDPRRNGIGVGVSFLFPQEPLNGGAGLSIHYRRVLGAAWTLTAEIGQIQVDRDATAVALEGELTLTRLASGIYRRVGAAGRWSFTLGGGVDWFAGDGRRRCPTARSSRTRRPE